MGAWNRRLPLGRGPRIRWIKRRCATGGSPPSTRPASVPDNIVWAAGVRASGKLFLQRRRSKANDRYSPRTIAADAHGLTYKRFGRSAGCTGTEWERRGSIGPVVALRKETTETAREREGRNAYRRKS